MSKPLDRIKTFLAVVSLFCVVVPLSGCIYLIIGSVGAVGGYAISSDTVQGTIERESGDVWEAASSVVNIMGRITRESQDGGKIEAIVNNAKVTIGVAQFTPKLVKLTVKARKSFFPSISTAQDVYIKIVTHLDTSNRP